jgi:Kef-type K+ transport system membrane component KefB
MLNKISIREIVFLTIFFMALAIYFDIHGEGHVLTFIINHVIALLLALILSKGVYHFYKNSK